MLRTQEFLSLIVGRGTTQVQSQLLHIHLKIFCGGFFLFFFFHFQLWSLLPWYVRGRGQMNLQAQVIPGLR